MAAFRTYSGSFPPAAERPACAYCRKPLKPWYQDWAHVPIEEAEDAAEQFKGGGALHVRIESAKPRQLGSGEDAVTNIRKRLLVEGWHGKYKGYGQIKDDAGLTRPLFDTLRCGVAFGAAAWRAGVRRERGDTFSITLEKT